MKLHKKEVFLSVFSLILGLLIYIFFRKGTYIHTFLKLNDVFNLADSSFFGSDFIKYFLPDFLWAFSLSNAFIAISNKTKKEVIVIGFVVIILAVLWEVLQLFEIVSGTFDWIDCFIYFFAVIAAVAMATERKRK